MPRALCAALFLLSVLPLTAASSLALAGCEANPEIRQTVDSKLKGEAFDKLTYEQQKTLRRQVLEELAAKYPREVEPQRELIRNSYNYDQDYYLELMARYRREAEAHPDDPLVLYFAGQVLGSPDPDASLRYLNRAKQLAPDFPWPDLEMSFVYSSGRTVDKKLATEHIDRFFAMCPNSDDRLARYSLSRSGSPETKKQVAVALRKRLEGETDPQRVLAYGLVWSLEFRTRPVKEHEAVRKQIGVDVARLETIAAKQPKPDAALLTLIRDGYKQSGAPEQTVTAAEDRIVSLTRSGEALEILHERWSKAHPEPEDPNDKAAWEKHNAESLGQQRDLIRLFPNHPELAHEYLFFEIESQIAPDRQELLAAFDDHMNYEITYGYTNSNSYLYAAEFLVRQKTQPQRALQYAQKARELAAHEHVVEDQLSRNVTDAELKDRAHDRLEQQQRITGVELRAALQSNLHSVDVSVPANPPDDSKLLSEYWADRAREAALHQQPADALAFYQKALFTRTDPPRMYHGRKIDNVGDEAKDYWNQIGGTESAYLLWSTPPAAGKGTELALGTWEKPTKAMPQFELTDLNGKSWSLKRLEGKTVLINVWATWCGFCVQELPKFEKLYEQVKDRPDVQILSFNIDEDAGLAAPFLKEHGYTFPVILASDTVNQVLDSIGIPQNWVVNRTGKWEWTQLGYNSADGNWQKEMLDKLGVK